MALKQYQYQKYIGRCIPIEYKTTSPNLIRKLCTVHSYHINKVFKNEIKNQKNDYHRFCVLKMTFKDKSIDRKKKLIFLNITSSTNNFN